MSIGILGAIADYYANGDTTELTALRSSIGVKLWADITPEEYGTPYVVLSETASRRLKESKNHDNRIYSITVAFDCYGDGREQVETILEQLENAFGSVALTVANRQHLATYFADRQSRWVDVNLWLGTLELDFHLKK